MVDVSGRCLFCRGRRRWIGRVVEGETGRRRHCGGFRIRRARRSWMPCRDLRTALRLCCNALVPSAGFSSGRSSAAVVDCRRCRRSSGAKSGVFGESCVDGWCAGPGSRAPGGIRPGPLHRRWSAGGEGWFRRIDVAAPTGRARGACGGGERRGREARRRCGWCLCGAFLE